MREQLRGIEDRTGEQIAAAESAQAGAHRDLNSAIAKLAADADSERSRAEAELAELRNVATRPAEKLAEDIAALDARLAAQGRTEEELRASEQAREEQRTAQQAFEDRILVALEELSTRVSRQSERVEAVEDRVRTEGEALTEEVGGRIAQIREQMASEIQSIAPRQAQIEDQADGIEKALAELAQAVERGVDGDRGPASPIASAQAPEDGPLTLSTASFEQLGELGLSVTQAARVIAFRNAGSGVITEADLDRIPGLPAPLRDRLAELT